MTSASDNEHHPVSDTLPGAEPKQIIFREISFIVDRDGLQFVYLPSKPVQFPAGGIDEFVDKLLDQPIFETIPPFVEAASSRRKETPLDLNVHQPTFVVFRLDRRWNWQFDPARSAISNKIKSEGSVYGGLTHVISKTKKTKGSIPPGDNCHIIYFAADPKAENQGKPKPKVDYFHGMNIYVEFAQTPLTNPLTPRSIPVVLDPDIRNPGGSLD